MGGAIIPLYYFPRARGYLCKKLSIPMQEAVSQLFYAEFLFHPLPSGNAKLRPHIGIGHVRKYTLRHAVHNRSVM